MGAVIANIYKGTMSSTSSATATLPSAVDLSKSIVVGSVRFETDTSATDHYSPCKMKFNSTTEIELDKLNVTDEVYVEWTVFEFASGVSVQHGVSGTGMTGNDRDYSISSVTLSEAFVIEGNLRLGAGYMHTGKQSTVQILDSTHVRFICGDSTLAGNGYVYQVVEWDGATVEHGGEVETTVATDTWSVTSIDQTKTIIFASCRSMSSGNDTPQLDFSADTTLRSRRGTTDTVQLVYQIVTLPEMTVQRAYVNMTNAQTSRSYTLGTTLTDEDNAHAELINAYGGMADAGTSNARGMMMRCTLDSTTQLTVDRQTTQSEEADFVYTVYEFTGGGGGGRVHDFASFFPAG